MQRIANMIWRIGDVLDFDEQLAWTRDAGFGGVGLHASAGVPGEWRGIEPAACSEAERARLRGEIATFSFAEIHAPFAIELRDAGLAASVVSLAPVLQLAYDLGVGVVTVHGDLSAAGGASGASQWLGPMRDLNDQAGRMRTRVALEIAGDFDVVMGWGLPNVGVNLDVGHMYLAAHRRTREDMGGIREIIRHLGPTLIHLHLHDVDGETDHIEIGTGAVEFDEIAAGLRDIRYPHGVTLELNPDHVTPDGIRRSAQVLSQCFRAAGLG